jgi:hypothetical protein
MFWKKQTQNKLKHNYYSGEREKKKRWMTAVGQHNSRSDGPLNLSTPLFLLNRRREIQRQKKLPTNKTSFEKRRKSCAAGTTRIGNYFICI